MKYDERYEFFHLSLSYIISAKHLFDQSLKARSRVFIPPALHNYRHSLELFLKFTDYEYALVPKTHALDKIGIVIRRGDIDGETVKSLSLFFGFQESDIRIAWDQIKYELELRIRRIDEYSVISDKVLQDKSNIIFRYPSPVGTELLRSLSWRKIKSLRKDADGLFMLMGLIAIAPNSIKVNIDQVE